MSFSIDIFRTTHNELALCLFWYSLMSHGVLVIVKKTVRGRNRPVKPTFHLIMNLPLIWMRMFETDVSSEGFRLLRRSSYHESISLSALKACPAIN